MLKRSSPVAQVDPKTGKHIRWVEVLVVHVHTDTAQVRALNGPLAGETYEVPLVALLRDA